jgi:hypothetical protein
LSYNQISPSRTSSFCTTFHFPPDSNCFPKHPEQQATVRNDGGTNRHSLILKLESRRILCEVQCATLSLTINSPQTDARVRESSIQRLNQIKQELQEIKSSLRLLRDDPAIKDAQQNTKLDPGGEDTAPGRDKKV